METAAMQPIMNSVRSRALVRFDSDIVTALRKDGTGGM